MKAFILKYDDGSDQMVYGKNVLDIVRRYDLATRDHAKTRIIELTGVQADIAMERREYITERR